MPLKQIQGIKKACIFLTFDQSNSYFVMLSFPLPSWIALAVTMATARKMALENKQLRNWDYLQLSHLVRFL